MCMDAVINPDSRGLPVCRIIYTSLSRKSVYNKASLVSPSDVAASRSITRDTRLLPRCMHIRVYAHVCVCISIYVHAMRT